VSITRLCITDFRENKQPSLQKSLKLFDKFLQKAVKYAAKKDGKSAMEACDEARVMLEGMETTINSEAKVAKFILGWNIASSTASLIAACWSGASAYSSYRMLQHAVSQGPKAAAAASALRQSVAAKGICAAANVAFCGAHGLQISECMQLVRKTWDHMDKIWTEMDRLRIQEEQSTSLAS
jgi:hypothetical protein